MLLPPPIWQWSGQLIAREENSAEVVLIHLTLVGCALTTYGTWRLLLPSQVESPLCGGEGTWWKAELQREGKTDKSGSAMGSLSFS